MGSAISKAANAIGALLGNAFIAPFKTIFGGSCEGICSGTWDITCFIEHLCISNLIKLLMVSGLCYISTFTLYHSFLAFTYFISHFTYLVLAFNNLNRKTLKSDRLIHLLHAKSFSFLYYFLSFLALLCVCACVCVCVALRQGYLA